MTTNVVTETVGLEQLAVEDKPEGPVAAAILAGGIGVFAMGFSTILTEMSAGFKTLMTLDAGVGALSGKAVFMVLVWLASWAGLHFALRTKTFGIPRAMVIALILIAVGVVTTIPTIYVLFAPAE